MTFVTVNRLRRALQFLRAGRTLLQDAQEGSHQALALMELGAGVEQEIARGEELLEEAVRVRDEPHAFVPSRRVDACLRCGGVADHPGLHPPEQINTNGAEQARGAA